MLTVRQNKLECLSLSIFFEKFKFARLTKDVSLSLAHNDYTEKHADGKHSSLFNLTDNCEEKSGNTRDHGYKTFYVCKFVTS